MKKIISIALVAVMALSCLALAGCQAKFDTQTYTRNYAYYEDGRQGDVIDAVVCDLTLVSDKEYMYTETTVIAHVGAGRAVTSWTYTLKGTYTFGAEDTDEMTKEITLSDPTDGMMVMNGAVTTAAEDAEILAYSFPKTATINYGSNMLIVAE